MALLSLCRCCQFHPVEEFLLATHITDGAPLCESEPRAGIASLVSEAIFVNAGTHARGSETSVKMHSLRRGQHIDALGEPRLPHAEKH